MAWILNESGSITGECSGVYIAKADLDEIRALFGEGPCITRKKEPNPPPLHTVREYRVTYRWLTACDVNCSESYSISAASASEVRRRANDWIRGNFDEENPNVDVSIDLAGEPLV